jgi:hypothetical protein
MKQGSFHPHFGALTVRLSCGHSETGQTNRLSIEPRRQRSQRPFPKSRDSTIVPSAPISETDVHCANLHGICYVQSNVNGGGFLKLKTGSFGIDTIPEPNCSEMIKCET